MPEEEDVLFSLTGFETTDGLEHDISRALGESTDKAMTIVEVDQNQVLLVLFGIKPTHANEVIEKLNANSFGWKCKLAEMEQEVLIEETEAFELWHNMSQDFRTCHLQAVPNPDGHLIQPKHDDNGYDDGENVFDTQRIRDPSLLELDNVTRIRASDLDYEANYWNEPFVIEGCLDAAPSSLTLARDQLSERLGDAHVRTGNRNTLIESGFDNSRPLAFSEAMGTLGCIVFTPTAELPTEFQNLVEPLVSCIPRFPDNDKIDQQVKYTLCIANQAGFGIGMHRHNAAFFLLVQGRKKWYMASPSNLTDPSHPGFYTTKSTHKCIQQPGEVLYVPNQWYHEIFNLEYTAGFQALPDE